MPAWNVRMGCGFKSARIHHELAVQVEQSQLFPVALHVMLPAYAQPVVHQVLQPGAAANDTQHKNNFGQTRCLHRIDADAAETIPEPAC